MSNGSSSDPSACIEALWRSLSRAGGHLSDEAVVESIGDTYYVALRLSCMIPHDLHAVVKTIIRQQLQGSGWSVQRLRIKRTFIDFTLVIQPTKRA
jgi:hypothetical protein